VGNSHGNPLNFILSGGEQSDCKQALPLLKGLKADFVLAHRGLDADYVVEAIEKMGAKAVIPHKKQRKMLRAYDKHLYKERNLVKRLFIWTAFTFGLNDCQYYPNLNYNGLTKNYLIVLTKTFGMTLTTDEKTQQTAMKKPVFRKATDEITVYMQLQQAMSFIAYYSSTEEGDLMSDLYLSVVFRKTHGPFY
jgi:transposase